MRFDFLCPKCGYRWDEYFLSREPIPESEACPMCETETPRNVIGSPAVIFKGDGWTGKGAR